MSIVMLRSFLTIVFVAFGLLETANGQCCLDTLNSYPTDNTAGELTFDPATDCIAVDTSVISTCSGHVIGTNTFECQSDNTWSPSTATCFAVSECPPPDVPENGYVVGTDYSLFASIEYGCNDTFNAVGADSAQCRASGMWSQDPPKCQASCERPETNGTVRLIPDQDRYDNGGVVQFNCNGLTMIGTDASTCRNGVWDPTPPSCYEKCTVPAAEFASYSSGNAEGDVVDHQTTIDFQCDVDKYINYQFIGNTVGSSVCNNGGWSLGSVYCSANCSVDTLAIPVNAFVSPEKPSYFDDEVVSFSCSSGASSNPDAESECQDGTWENATMECIQLANCDPPGSPANGELLGNDFSHGNEVEFRCDENYILTGEATITCDNGTWSGNVPICTANCDHPGSPVNGELLGNDFSHGSEVEFRCDGNYTLTGEATITCENGAWSGDVPTCTANEDVRSNGSASLECLSDSIRVMVDLSALPDLGGDVLGFEGDRNCTGEIDGDYLVFVTGFDECGTLREVDGEFDVYTNRIVNGANSGAIISRDLTVSFPLTCYYERALRLGNGYTVGGSAQLVQQTLVDEGGYNIDFAMFTDNTFTTKVTQGAGDVPVNEKVYFGIELDSGVGDVSLMIQSCWTTPSDNADDARRYDLITDRCQLEQTVERYDLDAFRSGFSLAVFTFLDGNDIYMYCSIAVCSADDDTLECTPCDQARRRRGVGSRTGITQMRKLSVGPVRWVREAKLQAGRKDIDMAAMIGDVNTNTQRSAQPWMMAVVVMAIVILALFVTNLVTARRNKGNTTRFN